MLTGTNPTSPVIKKWLAAVFHHSHTREGDPHLHTHVIVPNVAKNAKDQWRALRINIAGENRSRLELVYGNELARQLRMQGFGPDLVIRRNGLPELNPLRPLVARFSTATKAVLRAAKAAEIERPSKRKKAKWEGEIHPRSGLPVPERALSMMRRRTLANQIRKPKPKDADDPVRLADESERWKKALTNQEHRSLTRILDDLDFTNPHRPARVMEKLPPAASLVVRAAFSRLPIDLKPTVPMLLRAAVAESAGRHDYQALDAACQAHLIARRAAMKRLRERIAADHSRAIAIAAQEARTQTVTPSAVPATKPATITPTPVGTARSAGSAPAPTPTSRGTRR